MIFGNQTKLACEKLIKKWKKNEKINKKLACDENFRSRSLFSY
jgi:hypothetical protein